MTKTLRKQSAALALHLSPTALHHQLIKNAPLAMSHDGGDVKTWARKLRPKVRELLALPQEKKRVPLKPHTLWKRETELGVIEKIAFTAEPYAHVLAYMCTPRDVKPPYPVMVCLQGHTTGMHHAIGVQREKEDQPMQVAGDRDFGLGCMRRGIAALCIEQRSFGLRREQLQQQISSHGCHDAAMQALLVGRTLAGERVYDVDRGIDYLATRNDIDMQRIGVMGNSGGGTITIYAAALLARVKFAMPSCSFSSYRESIGSIYHCADNYVPGIMKYAEMYDVMGLFAPKPVVVVAGKDDPIFPIAGVRRAFRKLQAIYTAAGAPKACQLVVGPEGHRFYADLAWKKMLPLIKKG